MKNQNRMWNARNPNQGSFERVLCVCSAGLLRSPTIAAIMPTIGHYNTRAAGLEKNFALIPVDDVLLEWADSVVVCNLDQALAIRDMGFGGDIYNFNLPDDFEYMDTQLVETIKARVKDRGVFLV